MSYQVLARKWRPRRFADLVGQEHVVRALTNALREERLHHAYLLTGTRGVGKTTIARILAKSLNCETGIGADPCGECAACRQIEAGRFVDLLEIDAASNTGIDNIREVLENAQYTPTLGRYKVYIIDEVHMLSKSAFNAMLKTLEEPPAHVKFILATTDPQKVPVTVLSRCLQFSLRNMTPQQVAGHLAHVLDAEGVSYESAALSLLGRAAAGSMRDAMSLLDQSIAYGLGDVREEGVRSMLGAVDRRYLYALVEALSAADGEKLMAEAEVLAGRSIGFDSALGELSLLLHKIALAQTVPQAIEIDEPDRDVLFALAEQLAPADVQLYYQIAINGRRDLALAPDEHAGFTMTLLRMLAFHPAREPRPTQTPPESRNRAPREAAPVATAPNHSGAAQARAILANAGRSPAAPSARVQETPPDPEPEPARVVPPPEPEPEVAVAPPAVEERDEDDIRLGEAAMPVVPEVSVDEAPLRQDPEPFDGDWSALVSRLGPRMGTARMLAHNAVLKTWSEGRFDLAVPTGFRHMVGRDYQEKLKAALSEHFSRSVDVSVTVEEIGEETPAMQEARNRHEQLRIARDCLENDPVVQVLRREFDAVLLAETIQPVQEL